MQCIMHVGGKNFDPAPFLEHSELEAYDDWRRGDLSIRKDKWDFGGFKSEVSDASWDDFEAQGQDAILFMERFSIDLGRLRDHPEVEHVSFDFSVNARLTGPGIILQSEDLPTNFMRLAADHKIDVKLSLYPSLDSLLGAIDSVLSEEGLSPKTRAELGELRKSEAQRLKEAKEEAL